MTRRTVFPDGVMLLETRNLPGYVREQSRKIMEKLINLTPHVINIYDVDKKTLLMTLEPSGTVARVQMTRKQTGTVIGIPVFINVPGDVTGVPSCSESDAPDQIRYIVSALVRIALPANDDVFSPGELLRDSDGQPIGCIGLDIN